MMELDGCFVKEVDDSFLLPLFQREEGKFCAGPDSLHHSEDAAIEISYVHRFLGHPSWRVFHC
jgi:hypothetical protein